TEGNLKLPVGLALPAPPVPFCATVTRLMPGANCNISVKFLPFQGKSLTDFVPMTAPSSDEEDCTSDVSAATETDCSTSPFSSEKLKTADWLTTRAMPVSLATLNPFFRTSIE